MAEDRSITIAGASFVIPQPFDEGHICTAGEARALNQLLAENVRNNLAAKVKEGGVDQAAVTEYATTYEFSTASVPKPKLDPIEREARRIAKEKIRASLPEGAKLDDFDEESVEAEIERIAALPEVVKVAKEIVKARSKSSDLELGELNLNRASPASDDENEQE